MYSDAMEETFQRNLKLTLFTYVLLLAFDVCNCINWCTFSRIYDAFYVKVIFICNSGVFTVK